MRFERFGCRTLRKLGYANMDGREMTDYMSVTNIVHELKVTRDLHTQATAKIVDLQIKIGKTIADIDAGLNGLMEAEKNGCPLYYSDVVFLMDGIKRMLKA